MSKGEGSDRIVQTQILDSLLAYTKFIKSGVSMESRRFRTEQKKYSFGPVLKCHILYPVLKHLKSMLAPGFMNLVCELSCILHNILLKFIKELQ